MGTRATVLSVNKDGTLQLQAGILKISAKQNEVRVVEGETSAQKETERSSSGPSAPSAPPLPESWTCGE